MLGSPPSGADSNEGVVRVSDAWVRETVPGQSMGAAYLRIRSSEPVELVGLKSTASKTAELHQMSMKDNVMRMREAHAVAVSPDKEAQLGPSGTHIMLVDLKRPLKTGDAVDLKLFFRRANGARLVVPVRAEVRSIAEEAMHGH
jgi:hypothetical protein